MYEALASAEQQLGRPINPTLYSMAELRQRLADGSHFIARVLQQPKIWLTGTEHELVAVGKPDQDRRP